MQDLGLIVYDILILEVIEDLLEQKPGGFRGPRFT